MDLDGWLWHGFPLIDKFSLGEFDVFGWIKSHV